MAWTTYKGVNVPDVTTSDAGTFLADDVRTLADRVVFTAAADPTATNDTTQGFAPGSEWLNTSTLQTWECISAATGAAVWTPLETFPGTHTYNVRATNAMRQRKDTNRSAPAGANCRLRATDLPPAGGQSANVNPCHPELIAGRKAWVSEFASEFAHRRPPR